MKKPILIVFIGGSGNWCIKNHYPSLHKLQSLMVPLRLSVIIDLKSPYTIENEIVRHILSLHKPEWINPENMNEVDIKALLTRLHAQSPIHAMVIACNPTKHLTYLEWAIDNRVHVLCDKPLIVLPESASKVDQAKKIWNKYNSLRLKIEQVKKNIPQYQCCVPLRRRALTPFIRGASHIEDIALKYDQAITHMHVIINNGIHRFPKEFLNNGAHGYVDGIGSLSHSSYHYLDVLTWYVSLASKGVTLLDIRLIHLLRVRDYLRTNSYESLKKILEPLSRVQSAGDEHIPERILLSELDFGFVIRLLDGEGNQRGTVLFESNHTTYTPRVNGYDSQVVDPANISGRMSQFYIDVHQGPIQNLQFLKNDEVGEPYYIRYKKRTHPMVGDRFTDIHYKDVHNENTVTPQDLFVYFILASINKKLPKAKLRMLTQFDAQQKTMRLFSLFYEIIAEELNGYSFPKIVKWN